MPAIRHVPAATICRSDRQWFREVRCYWQRREKLKLTFGQSFGETAGQCEDFHRRTRSDTSGSLGIPNSSFHRPGLAPFWQRAPVPGVHREAVSGLSLDALKRRGPAAHSASLPGFPGVGFQFKEMIVSMISAGV